MTPRKPDMTTQKPDIRDDLAAALAPGRGEALDPVDLARRDLVKHLPKRFYERAEATEVEGGWELRLDGKPARTPARLPLRVAARPIMEAIAAEWAAQGERIDPAAMPLTRLVNVALDAVPARAREVVEDIVAFAGSDLICYRAGEPASLVAAESTAWDPALDWVRETLGARFALAEGVMHVAQPPEAIEALRQAVAQAGADPLALTALHSLTTLLGSALLALALWRGVLTPDQAWAAAHVGEDHQMRIWGEDAEALARRVARRRDFDAAALVANNFR